MEAAANGAGAAVPLVANVVGNVIAFVAIIALVNGILGWLGRMVSNSLFYVEVVSKTIPLMITPYKGILQSPIYSTTMLFI